MPLCFHHGTQCLSQSFKAYPFGGYFFHRILENLQGDERLYAKDFANNTDYSCLYNDLKIKWKKVMDTLPQRCREVFVLSRMNGLKTKNSRSAEYINYYGRKTYSKGGFHFFITNQWKVEYRFIHLGLGFSPSHETGS